MFEQHSVLQRKLAEEARKRQAEEEEEKRKKAAEEKLQEQNKDRNGACPQTSQGALHSGWM